MTACKKCIHYDICAQPLQDMPGEEDPVYSSLSDCSFFADKSRYVELPCKLGDKVYQTDGCRVYESTISEIEMSFKNTVYCTENIAFDERAIDRSIFLTREKAEKTLKGQSARASFLTAKKLKRRRKREAGK